ncbi:hypothetical protein CVE37_15120, partial [Pseudomonas syringae pv. actinidiae]|nr:hypothetical protein [Pseudomonas syringae pv. actinidiae]
MPGTGSKTGAHGTSDVTGFRAASQPIAAV